MTQKKCDQCLCTKDLSLFYADKTRPDGRRKKCKLCTSLNIKRNNKLREPRSRTLRERMEQENADTM